MFIIIPFLVLHNKKGNYYKRFDGSLTTATATRMATSLHEHHAFLYITLLMQETRTWRFLLIYTFYGRRRKTKTFLFLFLNLNPCKRTQHCWMVHVGFVCTRCCVLFGGCCAKFETFLLFLDCRCACMRVHHTFWYISIPSLHDYDVKMPNFTVYGESKQGTTNFSFWLFLNLSAAPKK